MELLAGDIGGTKTLLLRARWRDGQAQVLAEKRFDSAAYADLADMVRQFLAGACAPVAACLAVAGPVQPAPGGGTQARITNLPWQLDSRRLAQTLGIARLHLINDLAAVGYGLDLLAPSDLVELQAGQVQAGSLRAVLGIGTGLGMALVAPAAGSGRVFPSEAGHVDFAPQDARQVQLREFVRQRLGGGRVSCERLVSGSGLALHYEFLGGDAVSPDTVAARAVAGDALAAEAMTLFATVCGAAIGNLTLTCLPFGGLYLAGGVVQKNLSLFGGSVFLDAVRDKGRMEAVVRQVPIYAITEPRIGLLGAARYATLENADV